MAECKDNSLGRLIYFTAQELSNFAEKVLKPYDLTLEQFHLLKSVPVGSGLTQRQVGEIVNKKPANLTRILDRLESKELMVRRSNPDDRRATLVFLTDKGRMLVEKVHGGFEKFSNQIVRDISGQDQETARKVLEIMNTNLQEMTDALHK
jgi:DNA-binding MarR family transcriptional regulator